jgi:hypothetical protein
MNTFKIKTTAFEEEDLLLWTNLSKKQIVDIITPIVQIERDGEGYYDNDELINALGNAYPDSIVEYYSDELETILI